MIQVLKKSISMKKEQVKSASDEKKIVLKKEIRVIKKKIIRLVKKKQVITKLIKKISPNEIITIMPVKPIVKQ